MSKGKRGLKRFPRHAFHLRSRAALIVGKNADAKEAFRISVGKVTFMAVSTTTPEKDMIPAATMDKISLASAFFSNVSIDHSPVFFVSGSAGLPDRSICCAAMT